MSGAKKLRWLNLLTKLSPDRQSLAITHGKPSLIRDLHKIFKFIGGNKKLKISPLHKKIFKKNKKYLNQIVKSVCLKKVRKLLLKRTKGGGFMLSPILPIIISLACSVIPKLIG